MLIVGDVVARKKSIDPSLRLITMRLVSSRAVVQPLRTRDHSRSIDQLISSCGGGDVHSRSDSDETQQRSPDHSGFQSIVRVMAEIWWARLAGKSPAMAFAVTKRWRDSPF